MAVTYDTSLVFCDEDNVEDAGGWKRGTFDATSGPTEVQVYGFAQDTASAIVEATRRWGTVIEPGDSPGTHVLRLCQKANAAGAAMLAWAWKFKRSTGDANEKAWETTTREYEAIMGEGSSSGGVDAGIGSGGSLEVAVAELTGSGVTASHATQDGNTFATIDGRTNIEPDFDMLEVD